MGSSENRLKLVSIVFFIQDCQYELQDIRIVFAHAIVYYRDISEHIKFPPREAVHVLAFLIFLAHSHVLDKNACLVTWHQILGPYCPMPTDVLRKKVLKWIDDRNYSLHISDEEL